MNKNLKISVALLLSLFITLPSYAEEKTGVQYALAQYTFTNHIQAQANEQLDPQRGVLLANDNHGIKGGEGVSFVAHKTSSKTFKSIEIGGSINALEPEATINVVATW